jgi:hypothetical protein
MERALTLVTTGILTVAVSNAGKGKTVILPRSHNPSSSRESLRQTYFSDATWGNATCSYTTSAHSLVEDDSTKFDAIIRETLEFMKPLRVRNRMTDTSETIHNGEGDDERACLMANSDTDEECKSAFSSITLTNMVF